VSHPVAPLVRAFQAHSIRYVLIGVAGANFYAPSAGASFMTRDFDFFLPLDPGNLVKAWSCCEEERLDLWLHEEPLDRPRDIWLAERMVERRAVTRVTGPDALQVDLSLD
jgi:hypothetical protein